MARPPPQPLALALVISHFISQLRITQRRQAVRRNELSFPRREPLRIPSPAIVPLVRHPAHLVKPRRKHSLHVSLRSRQCLSQINHLPLLSSRSDERPVPAHILSRDPSRLPVPRPQQLPLSLVPHKLHRVPALRFLILPRRIRKLFRWRLSRLLCRIIFLRRSATRLTRFLTLLGLRGLAALRPGYSSTHHYQQTHHHKSAASPVPATRNLMSHSANILSANSAAFLSDL